MKKSFSFLLLTLLFSFILHAEDGQNASTNFFLRTSPIKDKITVRLTNSFNQGVTGSGLNLLFSKFSNFRMEGNYGLLNCLEVGTYFGYSSTGYTFGWLDLQEHRSHLLNYGAQANFHPISLFSTANSSRWDIWLSYKLGYAHHLGVVKQSHFGGYKQSFSENGFGAGLAFFPFKREKLGFHFEYNTGNWQLKQKGFREQKRNNDFRWGMSYKFSK